MEQLIARLNQLTVAQVKQAVIDLNDSFTDEANIVINAAMRVLENRMLKADFIAFCDSL